MAQKILLVDDDDQLAEMIKSRLQSSGYDLVTAPNGLKGLQWAHIANFDLIILDILMPDMDGGEVARKLKSDKATKHIPIIFLTSMVTKQEEINIDNVFYHSLGKPFDAQKLLKCVKDCLKTPVKP